MSLTSIYTNNTFIISTIYTSVIISLCMIVYFKTRKLYTLTSYEGIKYFCLGFLFYALGFLTIYVVNWKIVLGDMMLLNYLPIVMEYFLIMGGFYLTYSLIWKQFEDNFIIKRIVLLHLVAVIVAFFDFYLTNSYLMYIVELLIGVYAAFLIYTNYTQNKNHKFVQFYFIGMVCNILGWTMYFITWITHNRYPILILYAYIVTILVFLVLLYGVVRVTNNGKKTRKT